MRAQTRKQSCVLSFAFYQMEPLLQAQTLSASDGCGPGRRQSLVRAAHTHHGQDLQCKCLHKLGTKQLACPDLPVASAGQTMTAHSSCTRKHDHSQLPTPTPPQTLHLQPEAPILLLQEHPGCLPHQLVTLELALLQMLSQPLLATGGWRTGYVLWLPCSQRLLQEAVSL